MSSCVPTAISPAPSGQAAPSATGPVLDVLGPEPPVPTSLHRFRPHVLLPGGASAAEAVEPEAVGDDRDAGEGHGGAGDDGVEDPEGSQRDGGRVVDERPAQVLEDGAEGLAGQAD